MRFACERDINHSGQRTTGRQSLIGVPSDLHFLSFTPLRSPNIPGVGWTQRLANLTRILLLDGTEALFVFHFEFEGI